MIKVRNISKSYDQRVLSDVSLDVESGQTVSLIGPSGCGKSTLLRIVMGLIEPDEGDVFISGRPLNMQKMLEQRREMGYVIQKGGLFPHLTARENLTLVTGFLNWDPQKENRRVEELCDLTNLSSTLLSRRPDELSGGQTQRVSLMRALMLDPDIILLDEPLGSIDPLVRYDLQRELKSIFKKLGKTVLLVTHDLGEAAYLGDRITLMKGGSIIQEGTIRDIMEHPADSFVEKFVNAQRSPLEGL